MEYPRQMTPSERKALQLAASAQSNHDHARPISYAVAHSGLLGGLSCSTMRCPTKRWNGRLYLSSTEHIWMKSSSSSHGLLEMVSMRAAKSRALGVPALLHMEAR